MAGQKGWCVMSITDVMSHGQANELVNCLEKAGLTPKMAQDVINSRDNQLAKNWLVRLNELLGGQVSWGEAIEAFGLKALSISIAVGLRLSVPSLTFYDMVPLPRPYLKLIGRPNLFLVAIPPVSLINLQFFAPQHFYHDWPTFKDRLFARTVARGGYHLMFPTYPMSEEMTFGEQLDFLPRDMGSPFAVEVAYTAIAWHILTRQVLLTRWVRCADEGLARDRHVALKQNLEGQILIGYSLDSDRSPDEKIACGRYLNA